MYLQETVQNQDQKKKGEKIIRQAKKHSNANLIREYKKKYKTRQQAA